MSLPPSNPLLLAAQYRHADLLASLLERRVEPAPSLADRSAEDGSILGYALQINQGAGLDSLPLILSELIARGASADSFEPDLTGSSTYNYQTRRHERERRHAAEIAARKKETVGSIIFQALGPARLKELSDQLPLLHTAVASNSLWAARALLSAGADPNRDHPGRGLAASKVTDPEMLAALLSHGAQVTLRDASGSCPLQTLASARCEPKLLELAVAASEAEARGERFNLASPSAAPRRKKGEAAAAPLVDGLMEAIEQKQKANMASLWATLGRKRALAARDSSGRNILHAAIAGRQWAMAKRFLAAGVDPNAFDDSGHTPISLFITLAYQSDEKDRKGRQRHAMRDALMPHVQWDAKDALGRGYHEALWAPQWESKNDVYASSYQHLLWGSPSFDPLARGADGLCFIERVLPQWLAVKGAFEYYSPAGVSHPLHAIVASALDSGRADAALGQRLAEAFVGASSEPLWSQLSYLTRSLAETLAPLCKRVIELGLADPSAIRPPASLAKASPDLHASVEAWQLSALSSASASARRPARSL